jgi:hypothetical protein
MIDAGYTGEELMEAASIDSELAQKMYGIFAWGGSTKPHAYKPERFDQTFIWRWTFGLTKRWVRENLPTGWGIRVWKQCGVPVRVPMIAKHFPSSSETEDFYTGEMILGMMAQAGESQFCYCTLWENSPRGNGSQLTIDILDFESSM